MYLYITILGHNLRFFLQTPPIITYIELALIFKSYMNMRHGLMEGGGDQVQCKAMVHTLLSKPTRGPTTTILVQLLLPAKRASCLLPLPLSYIHPYNALGYSFTCIYIIPQYEEFITKQFFNKNKISTSFQQFFQYSFTNNFRIPVVLRLLDHKFYTKISNL